MISSLCASALAHQRAGENRVGGCGWLSSGGLLISTQILCVSSLLCQRWEVADKPVEITDVGLEVWGVS